MSGEGSSAGVEQTAVLRSALRPGRAGKAQGEREGSRVASSGSACCATTCDERHRGGGSGREAQRAEGRGLAPNCANGMLIRIPGTSCVG